jgi:transcriptional regulator with XRE-family HTH domain
MAEKTFAANLLMVMQSRGMTQVALAKKSGIKQQLISSYIRKSKMAQYPSLKNLMRLAMALECTVDELLGLGVSRKRSPDLVTVGKLTAQAQKLAEVLDQLPKDDWRWRAVTHLLLSENK